MIIIIIMIFIIMITITILRVHPDTCIFLPHTCP